MLQTLEGIQKDFNATQFGDKPGDKRSGKKVSLADLIVLGGCAPAVIGPTG